MTNLCDDHCWAGEGECPKCAIAFPEDWAQGGPPRPGATAAAGVPEGWKLVPIEPTLEMKQVMHTAMQRRAPKYDKRPESWLEPVERAYRSALIEAPNPPLAAQTETQPASEAADAARYRWLRSAWLEDMDAGEDVAWSPIMHSCSEDEMDADIDAAISRAQPAPAPGAEKK